jgi:hypothetical protein
LDFVTNHSYHCIMVSNWKIQVISSANIRAIIKLVYGYEDVQFSSSAHILTNLNHIPRFLYAVYLWVK